MSCISFFDAPQLANQFQKGKPHLKLLKFRGGQIQPGSAGHLENTDRLKLLQPIHLLTYSIFAEGSSYKCKCSAESNKDLLEITQTLMLLSWDKKWLRPDNRQKAARNNIFKVKFVKQPHFIREIITSSLDSVGLNPCTPIFTKNALMSCSHPTAALIDFKFSLAQFFALIPW